MSRSSNTDYLGKEKNMRKELEEKLFDLIYDMDMIGQEQELREAIAGASDEALVEMIRDYEEGYR
jgi:hypothetical protein